MKLLKYLFILIVINLFGQTPNIDPSWQLVFKDDFNSLDTNIWNIANYKSNGYPSVLLASNATIQNSNLVLTAKREVNFQCPPAYTSTICGCDWFCNQESYNFSGAEVSSKNSAFFYGYYEIKAKMDFVTGFWPAIWLFNTNNIHYSEIDINETIGSGDRLSTTNPLDTIMNQNWFTSNLHGGKASMPTSISTIDDYKEIQINDYRQYHTYGFEWQANKMLFYVDNMLVRSFNLPNPEFNHPYDKFDLPMQIIFDAKIYGEIIAKYGSLNITQDYPAKLYIDYFKYYQLKGDCSKSEVNLCYNFGTHIDEVKQVYQLGNFCYNTVPPGKNYIFRASDFIELNSEFYVPLGSEFFADVDDYCKKIPNSINTCNYFFFTLRLHIFKL